MREDFSMRVRDAEIAKRYKVIDRCKAFESDLLEIKDIVPDKMDDGIGFDLTGFLSDIHQVIIIPKYDIRANRGDYWEARRQLRENIVALAGKYDLYPSGDRIEDYGEHFYFVFTCGKSWRNWSSSNQQHATTCDKKKGRYHHAEYHQF